jgi:hypothetical protein
MPVSTAIAIASGDACLKSLADPHPKMYPSQGSPNPATIILFKNLILKIMIQVVYELCLPPMKTVERCRNL